MCAGDVGALGILGNEIKVSTSVAGQSNGLTYEGDFDVPPGEVTDSIPCGWPPFASRLVFEVWEKASDGSKPDVRAGPMCNHHTTTAAGAMVRIVYNGKDVTQLVPACTGTGHRNLCPLSSLREYVDGFIQPYASIEAACEVHS